MTVVYTSSNTSSQTIDSFDLPTEKVIHYKINVIAGNTTWYTALDVSHDGIQTSEQQYALVQTGITPLELVVSIANNNGIVNVTPTVIPTTFHIERSVIASNLYSENTLSGRNIKTNEGLGIYFNGANNISIRQSNNNVYTYANTYVTSDTLGPVTTKNSLLETPVASNNSIIATDGDYQVVISSGSKNNCQYYEIPVKVGTRYKFSANVYYTSEVTDSYVLEDRDTGPCKIFIGDDVAKNEYASHIATTSDQTVETVFEPTSNTIYLSIGFGDINNRLYVRDLYIKEYVPFHTYNQDEGAFYIKWLAVTAGNTILTLYGSSGNNRIYVDASNNVFINTVNCGAQGSTNKLVFSYDSERILASRNGNVVVTSTDTLNKYIANCVFTSIPHEFAYMSSPISNTNMVTLSNV